MYINGKNPKYCLATFINIGLNYRRQLSYQNSPDHNLTMISLELLTNPWTILDFDQQVYVCLYDHKKAWSIFFALCHYQY